MAQQPRAANARIPPHDLNDPLTGPGRCAATRSVAQVCEQRSGFIAGFEVSYVLEAQLAEFGRGADELRLHKESFVIAGIEALQRAPFVTFAYSPVFSIPFEMNVNLRFR
jgi:hypothetical protein